MTFDKKLAQKHLNKLLKKHKITVKKYSKSSCGRAWVESKQIIIPEPKDIDRFCVAMHEIGHVVKEASKSKMKLYQAEYLAEMYAIEQAKLLGFDSSGYEERARRYLIMNIAKGHCRKLNLSKIESEIKDFCKIDFSEWEGKKVFVSGWGSSTAKYPLKITFS